jgi:hypothetical protein
MPTVIREAGFEVRIDTHHPPPHVHVWKTGAVVRIDLATHEAVEVVGEISDRDLTRAERQVARNSTRLTRKWARLHGN